MSNIKDILSTISDKKKELEMLKEDDRLDFAGYQFRHIVLSALEIILKDIQNKETR